MYQVLRKIYKPLFCLRTKPLSSVQTVLHYKIMQTEGISLVSQSSCCREGKIGSLDGSFATPKGACRPNSQRMAGSDENFTRHPHFQLTTFVFKERLTNDTYGAKKELPKSFKNTLYLTFLLARYKNRTKTVLKKVQIGTTSFVVCSIRRLTLIL